MTSDTQDRATAERIAREHFASRNDERTPWPERGGKWCDALVSYVLAGMRQSSRRAVTEQEVAAWIRAWGQKKYPQSDWYRSGSAEELLTKWSPQEVGRIFVEMSAALSSPVDLDAVRREEASKAWDAAREYWWEHGFSGRGGVDSARNEYIAREYPAPAPDRVTLSDGSVVTFNASECNPCLRRNGQSMYIGAGCNTDSVTFFLNQNNTVKDISDVLEFASRCGEGAR